MIYAPLIGPTKELTPLPLRSDITLPSPHLSWSQVRAYLSCAACYEAHYCRGQQGTLGPPLILGSAIHAGLEAGRRARLAGKAWTLEECLEATSDGFEDSKKGLRRNGEAPNAPPILELNRDYDTWDQVKDHALAVTRAAVPAILRAEEGYPLLAVEAQIDMRGVFPFPFSAYADVLLDDPSWETDGILKDAKSAKSATLPDQWTAWQLCTYNLPWWKAGERLTLGIDQAIKTKEPRVRVWTDPGYTLYPSDVQMQYFEQLVISVAEKISAGWFPPSPNVYGCDYDHRLPAFSILRPELPVAS